MVKVIAHEGRETGSAASRRLRRSGQIPAVLYGEGGMVKHLSFDAHDFEVALGHRVVPGILIDVQVAKKVQLVKLQEVQRHPVKRHVSHIDLLAVSSKEVIEVSVELETDSDALRLKEPSLVLRGKANVLPATLSVPDSLLSEGTVLAGAIPLPKGVELVSDPTMVVADAVERE